MIKENNKAGYICNMREIEWLKHMPATGSYAIIYPKHFMLNEDENAIVTITSPESSSNLTFTGYNASHEIDEKVMDEFFADATENYEPSSGITKKNVGKRIFREAAFTNATTRWISYALAEENQIILISVNCEDEISSEDKALFAFIIAEIEIHPSAFQD